MIDPFSNIGVAPKFAGWVINLGAGDGSCAYDTWLLDLSLACRTIS